MDDQMYITAKKYVSEYKEEISELEKKGKELKDKYNELEATRAKLSKRLGKISDKMNSVLDEIDRTNNALSDIFFEYEMTCSVIAEFEGYKGAQYGI